MKMIKNRLFIAFLAFNLGNNLQSMESEKTFSLFADLLPEVQEYAVQVMSISSSAKSVKEAGKTINALARTSKKWNEVINEPQFCLRIIKNLAQQFNCSDQEAAEALQTLRAKMYLGIHKQFFNVCIKPNFKEIEFNYLYEFYKKYVDLNFTFYVVDPWQNKSEITLLTIAAGRENCQLIRMLLNRGANVNQSNKDGMTVLMIAAREGKINVVKCLLESSHIEINKKDKLGLTAFMHAVSGKNNNCSLIQMLLDRKAEYKEITTLILAISANKMEVVKCLLNNHKFAINQQDELGITALMWAIAQKNYSMIQMLLDAGADPEIADTRGITTLQVAQQVGDQEIIDLIEDAIKKKNLK